MQDPQRPLLPRELMEAQVAQVDLLMGTYPGEDEVLVDAATLKQLDALRDWTLDGEDTEGAAVLATVPSTLSVEMNMRVDLSQQGDLDEATRQKSGLLQLSVDVPVRLVGPEEDDTPSVDEGLPPPFRIRLRQPAWMNRADTARLNSIVSQDRDGDFVAAIDRFCADATTHLAHFHTQGSAPGTTTPSNSSAPTTASMWSTTPDQLYRVWFYFPSLSTRSKRDDLVNHAPAYSLTGFVLAGKPGVLCLEGTERDVDEYMRFIKTESWRDIPSHHKKVSERYRETVRKRVFDGMQEVTDAAWMGEKRGERGNRGDLRALEAWLDGLGLKGAFEKVLF